LWIDAARTRTLVGIDLRRPASWIALAMAALVGWWFATSTAADGGIVFLSAAVLAVAAIGDLPFLTGLPAGGRLPVVWACERVAWPLVGGLCGSIAAGGAAEFRATVPAVVVGSLLAVATTVVSRLSGVRAADAASLTLLIATASAAAGAGLAPRLGGATAGATAAWLLLGGLGWAWSRSRRGAIDAGVPGMQRAWHVAGADVLHVDALPANGPLRQILTRLAMAAALAAMAGWLVLEPVVDPGAQNGHAVGGQAGQWEQMTQVHHAAVAWALFTAAWFIGLAVPQATLQDGVSGAKGWDCLFRTAALAVRSGSTSMLRFRGPRPGPVRFAGGVALSQAAILGWPVLVCAVLALPSPAAARLPLCIVIGLAAAAALVTAIVMLGTSMRASRETMFAAAVAVALAILVGCSAITGQVTSAAREHGGSVQLVQPKYPSPASPLWQRLPGG
jgi:hypothetical protein